MVIQGIDIPVFYSQRYPWGLSHNMGASPTRCGWRAKKPLASQEHCGCGPRISDSHVWWSKDTFRWTIPLCLQTHIIMHMPTIIIIILLLLFYYYYYHSYYILYYTASSQNTAHATFIQPLQCVSQHPIANLHLSTHVATSNHDNQATIPMQSATRDPKAA